MEPICTEIAPSPPRTGLSAVARMVQPILSSQSETEATARARATLTLTLAVMRQVRLQGVTCGDREAFEAMLRAISLEGIDPVIDSVHPLERAQDAFRLMEANAHVGKIVIAV